MTVVDHARGGPGVDVVVSAPPGTALAAVLGDLAGACGRDADAPAPVVSAGGLRVPDGALLGQPPLVAGAVLVLDAATPARSAPDTPGVLHVVSGPGSGAVARLPLGRSLLGRGAGSVVALEDPSASPTHLELDATPSGVRVRDAGSTTGSLLDGVALGPVWRLLAQGAELELGRSRVRLAPGTSAPVRAGAPDGRGHLLLPPPPVDPDGGDGADRADGEAGPGDTVVLLPDPPLNRAPSPLAWPAVLAPVLVAVPLALLWSPLALVLALSGPLVAVLTRGAEVRSARRRHRDDLADHARETTAARARAVRVAARERELLERRHPDPAAVGLLAASAGAGVWAQAPGAPLAVRVGTARTATGAVLRRSRAAGAPGSAEEDDERLHLPAGPVVVDLARLEHLVVEAPDEVAEGVVRCLVGQLAVHHGPDQLRVLVRSGGPAWAWLRWLPHAVGPPSGPIAGPVGGPLGGPVGGLAGDPGPGPRTVVVDDAGAGLRLSVLDPAGAPSGTGSAVLRLSADGAGSWRGHRPPPGSAPPAPGGGATGPLPLVADLVSTCWAEDLARSLAPLRRSADAASAPTDVPSLRQLLSATGPDPADAGAVARSWRSAPSSVGGGRRSTELPLGVHHDGSTWTVDLERDGPHALVAGTTGSGKSTLLVALVLAMAVAEPPDELAVVVVDYKGGATAGRLQGLPHLVGAVTDLDEQLARRALESLRAEVRRRERVLAEHGAVDRAALVAQRADGARLLPRLLVVVDEVRVLAEEVPELVPGLVRLAAVGRSLGVHLVLATQRPAGVVSADARANTNLRVALRVRDVPDSLDVVDDPGAAHLPAGRPGAALVRRGGERLQQVGVASTTRVRPVPVSVVPLTGGADAADGVAGSSGGPAAEDEVPGLVAALARAAEGLARTPPPWLPALPDVLGWRTPDDAPGGGGGLPLALADDPAVPEQRPVLWPGDRPLVVAGGPGTGRTSLLRWLAAAARDREVLVVGDPAELGHLTALPRVSCVVDPADGEHLLRALARVAAGPDGAPGSRGPLLLVDRADRLLAPPPGAAGADRHEVDAVADLLRRLVDGGAAAVLTGDPSLLTSRAVAGVREVLLLSPADRTAALLAGVPSSALPVHWPAGRALRLRSGPPREYQLPLLGGAAARGAGGVDVQRAVVADLAAGHAAAEGARAAVPPVVRVPALPRQLLVEDLADGPVAEHHLAVGVGGPLVGSVGLPLPTGGGALVLGPVGSGRTNALRLLARQAQRTGRAVVEVRPRGVPAEVSSHAGAVVCGTGAQAARQLADLLEEPAAGGCAAGLVLVDDAEVVAGTPLEGVLLTLLDAHDLPWAVVAAGTSGLLPAHRGLGAALRRHRTGLLLHPLAPGDAEVLGARPSPVRGGPPGRASAVVAGSLVVVQLAGA